jgi:hypothetical protein
MLGVTLFGIFLTPVFYFVIQWFSDRRAVARQAERTVEQSVDDHGQDQPGDAVGALANGEPAQPHDIGVVHAASHGPH